MAHRNSKTPRANIEGFIAVALTDKTQKVQRTKQAIERTPDLPDTANVSNRHFGLSRVSSLRKQAAGDSDITPRQMIEDFMRSSQTVVQNIRGKRGRSLDQSVLSSESSSIRSTRSSFPSNPNISRYGEKETPRTYIEGFLAAVGCDVEETPALLAKRKKPIKRNSMPDIPSFSTTQHNSSILNDSTEEELADEPQRIRQPRNRNKIKLHVPTKESVDAADVDLPLQEEFQRFKRPRTRNRIQLFVQPHQNEAITSLGEVEIAHVDTPGVGVTPPSQQVALETLEIGGHTSSPEYDSPPDQPPGEHITEATQEIIREREITAEYREFTTEHNVGPSASYKHLDPLLSSVYTKKISLPQLETPLSATVTVPISQTDLSVKPITLISAMKGNQSLYAALSQMLVSPQPVVTPQSFRVSMLDEGMSPTCKVMMSHQNGTPPPTMSSSQLETKSSHLSQSRVIHSSSQQKIQTRATYEHLEPLPSAYTKRMSLSQLKTARSPTITELISQEDVLVKPITLISDMKGNQSLRDTLSQTLVSPHFVAIPQSVRVSVLDGRKAPTPQIMLQQNGNPQPTVSSQLEARFSHLSQLRVIRSSSQQENHTGGRSPISNRVHQSLPSWTSHSFSSPFPTVPKPNHTSNKQTQSSHSESMSPAAFGQQNRSGFAALLTSPIPPNSEREVDAPYAQAASPGLVRNSQPVDEEVRIQNTKPRRRKVNTVDYTVPPSIVKKLLANICKLRFSKEAVGEVCKVSEKYFDQMVQDLEAFAIHAGRKKITEADVELLIRRQGFVTERRSLTSLIEEYLPHEYRSLLIPVARSGNRIEPK